MAKKATPKAAKSRKAPAGAKPSADARPTLIDERDGACEICADHKEGLCDNCGKKIAVYENMAGHGYQAVTPSHFHIAKVEGIEGRRAIFNELCQACYKKHRGEVYPDENEWTP